MMYLQQENPPERSNFWYKKSLRQVLLNQYRPGRGYLLGFSSTTSRIYQILCIFLSYLQARYLPVLHLYVLSSENTYKASTVQYHHLLILEIHHSATCGEIIILFFSGGPVFPIA